MNILNRRIAFDNGAASGFGVFTSAGLGVDVYSAGDVCAGIRPSPFRLIAKSSTGNEFAI